MKDVTRIISERATRFLPVDMKGRLMSVFNRNSGNAAPANPRADDVPGYSAILNANRSLAGRKKSRFKGPLDQTQLAEPPTSATMRNPARQIAHDIEEAEVVDEGTDEPARKPPWEAEPKSAEVKARNAKEQMAAGLAYEAKPLE